MNYFLDPLMSFKQDGEALTGELTVRSTPQSRPPLESLSAPVYPPPCTPRGKVGRPRRHANKSTDRPSLLALLHPVAQESGKKTRANKK